MRTSSPPPRRPRLVILLVAMFLLLSFLGWLRLAGALDAWALMVELGAWPGPLYTAIGGLLWGLVGLAAALGLWTGQRWAPWTARIGLLVILLTYWADRLVVLQSGNFIPNAVFLAGLSIVGILVTFGVLALPGVRRYFSSSIRPNQGEKTGAV